VEVGKAAALADNVEEIAVLAGGDVVACDGLGRFKIARQTRTAACALTAAHGARVYVSFRAARALKVDLAAACSKVEVNRRRRQVAAERRAAGRPEATAPIA